MGWNGSGDLVMVFGVGGETKILVPKKCFKHLDLRISLITVS